MHSKCNTLNHPETIPSPTPPWSLEKLSSMKPVPGTRKVGDHCPGGSPHSRHTAPHLCSVKAVQFPLIVRIICPSQASNPFLCLLVSWPWEPKLAKW